MEVTFLTPLGALFGLAALVPAAVYVLRERRLRGLRKTLRLEEPTRRSRSLLVGALIAVCGLLALAAAQPVVATSRTLEERQDAEVFVVLDTSRSMLAGSGPGAPTRFDRARGITERFAAALPEVPVGVASLTDRLLPHLFPTTDRRVLAATLEKTLSVESPGPSGYYTTRATTYDALTAAPTLNYFRPKFDKRVLLVLTDGETRPLIQDLPKAFSKKPKIQVVFVRLWAADERVYLTGLPEVGYEPDEESEALLGEIAASIDARVVQESEAGSLPQIVGDLIGTGPTIDREHEGRRRALMPWITLAAVFPLGFVLFRRNA